jgi:hypothetical protein
MVIGALNMSEQTELESLARGLKAKYPGGYLSEIEVSMPYCGIAVRSPLHGLDSPRAIIQGSYQELRAFEITYQRLRAGG